MYLTAAQVKVTQKAFKVKKKLVEISTLVSNHHIELNPSDVGMFRFTRDHPTRPNSRELMV